MKQTIGIIGQGFVGSAVREGMQNYYNVVAYDKDPNKFSNAESILDVVSKTKMTFLCVPTPMRASGQCDLRILRLALDEISASAQTENYIVVIKSTIPPGTTEQLNTEYSNLDIVFNPEFLTERNAIKDYENQNRIILGGVRPATTELKRVFSKVFPKAHIIKTDSTHAEMVKYLTNTFLSVKVSFANEIYQLCERLGIDYDKVVEYATYDERLGKSHWNVPGHDGDFGFGGHCFPKDLKALLHLTKKLGTINNVLSATNETNDSVRKNRDWEGMKGRAVT